MRSLIRATWLVGYQAGEPRLIRDGQVVWEDDHIIFVGRGYSEPVDVALDAPGRLVSPGFVNAHAIANVDVQTLLLDRAASPLSRPQAHLAEGTSLAPAGQAMQTSAEFAVAGLLKGGSTTFVAVTAMALNAWSSPPQEAETLAETAGRLGARAYISNNFQSGAKYRDPAGIVRYAWNEDAGQAGLTHALEFDQRYRDSFDGRVSSLLFPYTAESCSPSLLKATREAAGRQGIRIHIHAGEYLPEFYRMLNERGETPIGYLDKVGLLGPDVIVAHAVFTSAHPQSGFPPYADRDLQLLADRRAHVAHCPLVLARVGNALTSFSRYRRYGINVALGTDTFPPDMLEEMRLASLVNKIVDRDKTAAAAGEIYTAATLSGARALGRQDLGRLAPGSKADLIVLDLNRFDLGPLDDPIQTLVHAANRRDVETVIVDGRPVVQGGQLIGVDEQDLLARARAVYSGLKTTIVENYWPGRPEADIFPAALPVWQ